MRRSIQTILLGLAVLFFVSAPADGQAGGRGGWHGGGGHRHGWHGGGYKHYGGHGYGGGYYRHGYRYGYPRVVVGVGLPAFGWGWPYYGYGYGWYGPPAYPYGPARAVVTERPVYVQRPAPAPAAYWYYCESEGGYYPDVPTCPEAWIPVPPRD